MINILLCGNEKVFDGALTELISITNKTKEPVNCYIFTMNLTRVKPEYTAISDKQVEFLNKVIKSKNVNNCVQKVDVTDIYEQEFMNCKNENAYCTPYTLLRLLADLIPNMPDKLLYLDIDMMANGDISELYNIDISEYEYAAVREKYGSKLIALDYINAGMLLLNMKKIKETKLLEKARDLIRTTKMLFADQDAVYRSTTKKLLLPRKFNEQAWFNKKGTIICHFCKRMLWFPYPRTENYKQWNIEEVHNILKCHTYDEDLNEYLEWKKDAEKEGGKALDDIEEARVTVSGDVKASVNGLLESYQDMLSKQIAKEHPMHMVQYRLKQAQGDLSGLTGQKLYQKTAEILYYKSLTRIDLGVKKDQSLKNAMIPKEIRKQRDRLMELPAFQKLEKMPDAELRSLAAGKGADILMDRFITQVAKDMQAQKETSIPDPEPLQPKASEPGMKTL